MRVRLLIAAVLLLAATPLLAHHGKDFLLVESYELPHPRLVYGVTAEEWIFGRSSLSFRDEPSLLIGVSDELAVEVHAHIAKGPDDHARLEAIAPAVHFRLFDSSALHTAVSVEYEIGRHGAGNNAAARLIVGYPINEGAIVGNLGLEHSSEGTRAFYAVGYRPEMEAPRTWGIEAQGSLHHGEEQQAIAARYTQINDRLTIKAGVGAAFGTGKVHALIRTGIVWRF